MSLSPVKLLALARLLGASDQGETEKKLSDDLKPLVGHRWQGAEWADRLGAVLDELESAGAYTRIRKGKTTRLALTGGGRRLALEALGVEELPPKTTWAKLKSSYLPALALGRPGPVVGDLKAEILRARYGLDLGDGKPSMALATEKMAAKLLGLEPAEKFNADTILRKLLRDAGIELPPGQKPGPTTIRDALFRRELGDPSAKKPLELLATRSVGARQNSAPELVSAVLRSWVDRPEGGETVVDISEPPPAPIDLEDFARLVTRAARESPGGWFGDAKVFISHVWRALRDDPAFRGVDDAAFKGRLVEAHRASLIELSRADLVETMDPSDVRESSTPYLNVVYHFVRTEEPAR